MGNPNLGPLVSRDKENLRAQMKSPEALYAEFLRRKAQTPAVGAMGRANHGRRLGWLFPSLATALVVAVALGLIFLTTRPKASPLALVAPKGPLPVFALTPGNTFRFAEDTRIDLGPQHSIQAEKNVLLAVTTNTQGKVQIALLTGTLRVQNQSGQNTNLPIQAEGYEFQELGTRFDLTVNNKQVALAVLEGRVEVTRKDPPLRTILNPGERWQSAPNPAPSQSPKALPHGAATLPLSLGRNQAEKISKFWVESSSGLDILVQGKWAHYRKNPAGTTAPFAFETQVPIQLPENPWFFGVWGNGIYVGDREGNLHLYDPSGLGKTHQIGALGCPQIYPTGPSALIVLANGDLVELERLGGPRVKGKVATGNRHPGLILECAPVLVIPDISPRVSVISLTTGIAYREISLSSPATGPLEGQKGGVFVPGPNMLLSFSAITNE